MLDPLHVRYAEPGKLAFTWRGQTIYISEPLDVILVGVPEEVVRPWILWRYGWLLASVPERGTAA